MFSFMRTYPRPWLLAAILCVGPNLAGYAQQERGDTTDQFAVPVTVDSFASLAFHPEKSAPATVVTLNNATISAEISGLLREINPQVGDRVDKGDVVARIDCRDANVELERASAALKATIAQHEYNKSRLASARKLAVSNNISSDEMDKRKAEASSTSAEVEKAEAALSKARLSLDRCDIRAPFNAVVTERLASVGDFLDRGSAILRLLDTDSTEVSARIQEEDLDALRLASHYAFANRDRRYELRLRAVLPMMESRLRSYEARFLFVDREAFPGTAGRLIWATPEPHIPADLLVRRGSLGVFVAIDDRARFVEMPEAQEGKPVAISGGLKGDLVIEGRFNLKDGDLLDIQSAVLNAE